MLSSLVLHDSATRQHKPPADHNVAAFAAVGADYATHERWAHTSPRTRRFDLP